MAIDPLPPKGKTKGTFANAQFDVDPINPATWGPRPTPAPETTGITVKIESFDYHGNGIITLRLPAIPLQPEHHKMFRELFPNTADQAFDLLNKEAILASIYPGGRDEEPKQYEERQTNEKHY